MQPSRVLRRLVAFNAAFRLRDAAGMSLDVVHPQIPLRAGVPGAVIPKVRPGSRVIGLEAAEAIGVVVACCTGLTLGNRTADDRAGGKPTDHGTGAIVTTSPAMMSPTMMAPAAVMPPMMTPVPVLDSLRRHSCGGSERSVDR